MPAFKFRLGKLLEYRQHLEEQAKDEYLDRQARRFAAEAEVELIKERRQQTMTRQGRTLTEHIAAERYMERMTDELRAGEMAIAILFGEEEAAKAAWLKTKSEAEALDKLREKDLSEWIVEENRREQNALDEWAVMRRAA